MVTAVQHLHRSLGIDLTQPAITQSRANLLPGIIHDGDSDLIKLSPYRYLEAIYDAVVGINEEKSSGFDKIHGRQAMIGIPELTKLINIAATISLRDGITAGQKQFLDKVIFASSKYISFLSGEVQILKKDMANLGNRHTLIRANRGHVYEMTNSMTQNELALFRRKTRMVIGSVENHHFSYQYCSKKYAKIEMGSGAFGKTRIARDIGTNTFVAVKKLHPRLNASVEHGFYFEEPEISNFYRLDSEKQRAIENLKEYVISPIDECRVESRQSVLANTLNNFIPSSLDEMMHKLDEHKALEDALGKLGDGMEDFLEGMLEAKFAGMQSSAKTIYGFSELGISTIDGLINKLNILRSCFESRNIAELSLEAKNLLTKYSKTYHDLPVSLVLTSNPDQVYQKQGIKKFESGNFKLKDPVHNQKFLNTLGKKMLSALANLNDCDISHQDIKPDNIVICQNADGSVSVKLIDIDLIKKISGERTQPDAGCLMFMPPEALICEKDGSISYTGEKGDAYAMGLTLRRVLGFSCVEIARLNELQRAKVAIDRIRGSADREIQTTLEIGLAHAVSQVDIIGDFQVQKQLHIKAIDQAVPEALSLKDMADLMLKDHPGKRNSAKDVLMDYSFFNDKKNLLDEAEFSDHIHRICRFGIIIDKKDATVSGSHDSDDINRLAHLRQSAMQKMILARGQDLVGYEGGSLSKKESHKVKNAEKKIQTQAGARRLGRSVKNLFSPAMNDADKKITIKKIIYKSDFR